MLLPMVSHTTNDPSTIPDLSVDSDLKVQETGATDQLTDNSNPVTIIGRQDITPTTAEAGKKYRLTLAYRAVTDDPGTPNVDESDLDGDYEIVPRVAAQSATTKVSIKADTHGPVISGIVFAPISGAAPTDNVYGNDAFSVEFMIDDKAAGQWC